MRAAGRTCDATGCPLPTDGNRYCRGHAQRLQSTGSLGNEPIRPKDGIPRTYSSAHRSLREKRGPASSYTCVDCGGAARHWSLNHGATQVVVVDGRTFSSNPSDYEPRCAACHSRYDK